MDMDNLAPGPDLDAIDFDKLDRGNAVEETPPAEEEKKEELPRDAQGKFAKKDKEDEPRIPKAEFDKRLDKERGAREAAEQRAAELQRQLSEREESEKHTQARSEQVKALDTQLDELEAKREKLLLDGEGEKAAELRKEISQLTRQIARIEAQEESSQIVSQQLEKERVGVAIARLEADHPELNPRSEQYDDDLVQMILAMQSNLLGKGIAASQALTQAAEKVMKRVAAPAKAEESAGLSQAKQQAEERRKEQVEAAVSAQKAQPPTLKDVGVDSDKAGEKGLPDVSKMSVEEFEALPEATRARLRGDLV